MSSPRAQSNQALYYARIVLGSWATLLEAQEIPSTTLHGAFAAPVLAHLKDAYGWFLLELANQEHDPSAELPLSSADVAAPAAGKAVTPELRELAQLEKEGFLNVLWGEVSAPLGPVSADNLASAAVVGIGFHELQGCAESFAALCERMRNSLDEY